MAIQVTVCDNVLPVLLVDAAYDVFRKLVMPPGFFYVTVASVVANEVAEQLSAYLPRPVCIFLQRLLATIMHHAPERLVREADGFEVWLGLTTAGDDTAYLHIDNDEGLRRQDGKVYSPLMGTIFHLGPKVGLSGGDTVFDMAGRDPEVSQFFLGPWHQVEARIANPLSIPQRAGRLIMFSGDLPHAVRPIMNIDPSQVRVALLANLWDRRLTSVPKGVCAIATDAFPRVGSI